MKRTKLKIVLVLLGFTVIVAGIVLYMYNKPHAQVANLKSDVICNVTTLLQSYESDEAKANALYLDKIIEVKGIISEASNKDNKVVVVLEDEASMGTVICYLVATENLKINKLKKGDSIVIKGVCTGYLMDVVLVKCVIKNS